MHACTCTHIHVDRPGHACAYVSPYVFICYTLPSAYMYTCCDYAYACTNVPVIFMLLNMYV